MATKAIATRKNSTDNVLGTDGGPASLMKAALGFTEISLDIPENATLNDVEKTLQLAINGYKRLSEASERLKPIIGRILITIQSRNLFKPEYKNFTAFLMDRVVMGMGLGRSTAFDSLRIARAFPTLTQEEYLRYGASRLLLAAKITDEQQPDYREVLKSTSVLSVEDLKNQIKESHGNESTTFVVSIRVSKETKAEWNLLLESVETSPGDLFTDMVKMIKDKIAAGYTTRRPQAGRRVPAGVGVTTGGGRSATRRAS